MGAAGRLYEQHKHRQYTCRGTDQRMKQTVCTTRAALWAGSHPQEVAGRKRWRASGEVHDECVRGQPLPAHSALLDQSAVHQRLHAQQPAQHACKQLLVAMLFVRDPCSCHGATAKACVAGRASCQTLIIAGAGGPGSTCSLNVCRQAAGAGGGTHFCGVAEVVTLRA